MAWSGMKPWTDDGFRTSRRKELVRDVMAPIRKAGLVFHGLRKSAVFFLSEVACTDAEVSAITGIGVSGFEPWIAGEAEDIVVEAST
jgi:hypothetical protein